MNNSSFSANSTIVEFIAAVRATETDNLITSLEPEWAYLVQQEQKLKSALSLNTPAGSVDEDDEFGQALYYLNQILPADVKTKIGLPQTTITTDPQSMDCSSGGIVTGNGTLFVAGVPFAELDVHWAEAFCIYLWYKFFKTKPAFPSNDKLTAIPTHSSENLTIAVFGDWGTAPWTDKNAATPPNSLSPSQLVKMAINGLSSQPAISMHLGDVYYSGQPEQETAALIDEFPAGSLYNFTLNSNHEMFCNGKGYYEAIGSLDTRKLFTAQNGLSYFALTYGNWYIIGLDSGYNATGPAYFDGALDTDGIQAKFISSLKIPAEAQVLVFTHHPAIPLTGATSTPSTLAAQVTAALKRNPDYWYYGHIHCGVVYSASNDTPGNCRCIGHSAIPCGIPSELTEQSEPVFKYCAQTIMANPSSVQQKRIRNGFALLTLKPTGEITEQVFEVGQSGSDSYELFPM